MIIFYFIVGIIAGIIGANMAKEREQNPALWFIVCFLFPIAVFGLLFIEKKRNTNQIKNENIIYKQNGLHIYTITLNEDITYDKIKKSAYEFYYDKGLVDIIIDTEKQYLVKSKNKASLLQIENKNDKIILSIKNIQKPYFLSNILSELKKEKEKEELQIAKSHGFNTYKKYQKAMEQKELEENQKRIKQNTKKIIELGNMLEKGLITQEEFETMKQELV